MNGLISEIGVCCRNAVYHIHTLGNVAECGVLTVKEGGIRKAQEKTRRT